MLCKSGEIWQNPFRFPVSFSVRSGISYKKMGGTASFSSIITQISSFFAKDFHFIIDLVRKMKFIMIFINECLVASNIQ